MYNTIFTSMFVLFIEFQLYGLLIHNVIYLFKDPFASLKEIILPVGWILYSDVNIISLYKPNLSISDEIKVVVEKQIVFQSSTLDINYYVHQKCINPSILDFKLLSYPLDILQIIETIKLFERKQICQGGPKVINFPGIGLLLKLLKLLYIIKVLINNYYIILYFIIFINLCLGINIKNTYLENETWYHNKCSILTNSKKRCEKCNLLFPHFRMYKKRLLIQNNKYVGPILTPTRRCMLNKLLRKSKSAKRSNKR